MIFSCVNNRDGSTENLDAAWLPIQEKNQIDNAILATQQLLIGKLVAQVESSNFESAVRFCARNAQHLTDSMSQAFGYNIRRISPRNRNENNVLNHNDELAFAHFENSLKAGAMDKYFIPKNAETYYAPILLGMPLCLQCHGKEEDRNAEAYTLVKQFYPNDKAINYDLGALRGMWKVTPIE